MWKKVEVIFKLKTHLHIGYMPFKGSVVSPTRYYVPGRNFWGAVTKGITEYLCGKKNSKPSAEDYRIIGKKIIENFRFSYFYLYDGKILYMPHYTEEGLKFGEITRAEFEHRFIGSIISTAIDSKSRTAKDETLHEIEFINNKFRDEKGKVKPVMVAGCIWIKKDAKINKKDISITDKGIFIDNFNIIQELILGGESKYGFGHVLLESINKTKFLHCALFNYKDSKEEIEIKLDGPIPAHLKYTKDIKFKGEIELLTGRGYYDPKTLENKKELNIKPGAVISKSEYYLSPGTVLKENINCTLNWDGTLEVVCR